MLSCFHTWKLLEEIFASYETHRSQESDYTYRYTVITRVWVVVIQAIVFFIAFIDAPALRWNATKHNNWEQLYHGQRKKQRKNTLKIISQTYRQNLLNCIGFENVSHKYRISVHGKDRHFPKRRSLLNTYMVTDSSQLAESSYSFLYWIISCNEFYQCNVVQVIDIWIIKSLNNIGRSTKR